MTKLNKLSDEKWSKILTKIISTRFDGALNTFRKVFMPLLTGMEQEIYISPKKQVYDLYLEYQDNKIIVKGEIPKNYKDETVLFHIIHLLFMYMNRQPQRGKGKNPNLWYAAVSKLNNDLFGCNLLNSSGYIDKYTHEILKLPFTIIEKEKEKDSKSYSFMEEINYNILSKYIPQNPQTCPT